jgi:hypothetical protein
MLGNTPHNNFRVVVVNGAAKGANVSLSVILFGNPTFRGCTTIWAEFHWESLISSGGQLAVGAATE